MANVKEIQVEFIDIVKEIKNAGYSDEMLLDKIVLHSTQYKRLFGNTLIKDKNRPWKRGVVKITNPEVNISILRRFFGKGVNGLDDTHFFLPKYSQNMLMIKRGGEKIVLKKGNAFAFYWQHPSDSLRATFRATFIGTIVAIAFSILIAKLF